MQQTHLLLVLYLAGLHYSVRLEEILLCVLYRAELVMKLSKESTAKVQSLTSCSTFSSLMWMSISGKNFAVNKFTATCYSIYIILC